MKRCSGSDPVQEILKNTEVLSGSDPIYVCRRMIGVHKVFVIPELRWTQICLNPDLRWKPTPVYTIFSDLKPRFSCKSTPVNVYHLHQFYTNTNFSSFFSYVFKDFFLLHSAKPPIIVGNKHKPLNFDYLQLTTPQLSLLLLLLHK